MTKDITIKELYNTFSRIYYIERNREGLGNIKRLDPKLNPDVEEYFRLVKGLPTLFSYEDVKGLVEMMLILEEKSSDQIKNEGELVKYKILDKLEANCSKEAYHTIEKLIKDEQTNT